MRPSITIGLVAACLLLPLSRAFSQTISVNPEPRVRAIFGERDASG